MILVLTVCCQAAVTRADDVRLVGTSENTELLPLPYLDILHQTYLLSDSADDQYAWAKATEISTNDRPSYEESEEGTDLEPILVVPGRSLVGEMQGRDAPQPGEGFPEGNVLPLDPWLAENFLVGTTVMQPNPSTEEAAHPVLQLGIPLPIQVQDVKEHVTDPMQLPLGELLPLQLGNEAPNQPFGYMVTVPTLKYGNRPNDQETVENPTLAARFEMWKEWTLNDYCTAFRYISQQFAQVDWASLLSKIQEGESVDQGSFYMELLLRELN
jgi:hypothetical protein